ncbi:hypothetical protein KY289_008146 [Solanum tuberosum]|nr:hypothetical protein KY289_008146 [Solanum tuberosum]
MAQWNPNISHLCGLCEVPVDETVDHSFLKGEVADSVWRYFAGAAGLLGPWVQVKQVLLKWWDAKGNSRQKMTFNAIPNVILWFLWKRRNTILHDGSYPTNRVIWDISNTIKNFIKLKFKYPNIPNNWPQMVALLDSFRLIFTSRVVRWSLPPLGWWKCNTNGASRGNPSPSTIAFCVRDSSGDLVGAKELRIQDTTNIVVEAMALKEGLKYCLENGFSPVILESDSL